jgi:hypothetical protein
VVNPMNRAHSDPPSNADDFAALLASDLAAEVRTQFNTCLDQGENTTAATAHVFAAFRSALDSPHTGPVVLLALAVLQLREGSLNAVIRDAALDLIDSGEAMAAFPAAADARRERRELLKRFAIQLRETAAHVPADEHEIEP